MKHLPLQLSARAVVTDREGRILLVKHASHKPWTLPGGHLEEGETFQEACVRELREELDITIELVGLVTIYSEGNIQSLPAPIRSQVIEYENERGPQRRYEEFFLAHHITGTPTRQVSEIAGFEWFSVDDIRNMSEGDIYRGIQELILGVPF